MNTVLTFMQESVLPFLVETGGILFNLIGIGLLFYYGIRSFIGLLQKKAYVGNYLGHGITTALTFMMIAEILHTTIADDFQDIASLAVIVLIRVLMSFHLRRERKDEEIPHPEAKNN